MAQFLLQSLFHSRIQESDQEWHPTNMAKGMQQISQFWKWHPAPVRAYSYLMTRPVKGCLGQNWNNLGDRNRVQPDATCWLSKFWIQEQFQNKPEKVDFFEYIFQYKKKSRAIQEIPEPLSTLKVSLFNNPPIKPNLKSSPCPPPLPALVLGAGGHTMKNHGKKITLTYRIINYNKQWE